MKERNKEVTQWKKLAEEHPQSHMNQLYNIDGDKVMIDKAKLIQSSEIIKILTFFKRCISFFNFSKNNYSKVKIG